MIAPPFEWFIADTHFGDKAVLRYRPFATLNEMADEVSANWRELVKPEDIVWVIGDTGRDREVFRDLPGRKRLVGGNVDGCMRQGFDMFEQAHGCKYLPGLVLTHIPVHPTQVGEHVKNVHGHLHQRLIMDDRYLSVCVDQTQWRPVSRSKVLWALNVPVRDRYPLKLGTKKEKAA